MAENYDAFFSSGTNFDVTAEIIAEAASSIAQSAQKMQATKISPNVSQGDKALKELLSDVEADGKRLQDELKKISNSVKVSLESGGGVQSADVAKSINDVSVRFANKLTESFEKQITAGPDVLKASPVLPQTLSKVGKVFDNYISAMGRQILAQANAAQGHTTPLGLASKTDKLLKNPVLDSVKASINEGGPIDGLIKNLATVQKALSELQALAPGAKVGTEQLVALQKGYKGEGQLAGQVGYVGGKYVLPANGNSPAQAISTQGKVLPQDVAAQAQTNIQNKLNSVDLSSYLTQVELPASNAFVYKLQTFTQAFDQQMTSYAHAATQAYEQFKQQAAATNHAVQQAAAQLPSISGAPNAPAPHYTAPKITLPSGTEALNPAYAHYVVGKHTVTGDLLPEERLALTQHHNFLDNASAEDVDAFYEHPTSQALDSMATGQPFTQTYQTLAEQYGPQGQHSPYAAPEPVQPPASVADYQPSKIPLNTGSAYDNDVLHPGYADFLDAKSYTDEGLNLDETQAYGKHHEALTSPWLYDAYNAHPIVSAYTQAYNAGNIGSGDLHAAFGPGGTADPYHTAPSQTPTIGTGGGPLAPGQENIPYYLRADEHGNLPNFNPYQYASAHAGDPSKVDPTAIPKLTDLNYIEQLAELARRVTEEAHTPLGRVNEHRGDELSLGRTPYEAARLQEAFHEQTGHAGIATYRNGVEVSGMDQVRAAPLLDMAEIGTQLRGTFYRGIGRNDPAGQAQPGDYIDLGRARSFSSSEQTAQGFGNDWRPGTVQPPVIRVQDPKGVYIDKYSENRGEKEAFIGKQFQVQSLSSSVQSKRLEINVDQVEHLSSEYYKVALQRNAELREAAETAARVAALEELGLSHAAAIQQEEQETNARRARLLQESADQMAEQIAQDAQAALARHVADERAREGAERRAVMLELSARVEAEAAEDAKRFAEEQAHQEDKFRTVRAQILDAANRQKAAADKLADQQFENLSALAQGSGGGGHLPPPPGHFTGSGEDPNEDEENRRKAAIEQEVQAHLKSAGRLIEDGTRYETEQEAAQRQLREALTEEAERIRASQTSSEYAKLGQQYRIEREREAAEQGDALRRNLGYQGPSLQDQAHAQAISLNNMRNAVPPGYVANPLFAPPGSGGAGYTPGGAGYGGYGSGSYGGGRYGAPPPPPPPPGPPAAPPPPPPPGSNRISDVDEARRLAYLQEASMARNRVSIAQRGVREGSAVQAGKYFVGPDQQVIDSNGKLITQFRELREVSDQLTASLHKEALAQRQAAENAARTPLGEFYKGVFGAGGRKYRGGAKDVDAENPLNGLAETAGVVAKYEVLGRGMQAVAGVAVQAIKNYAELDTAIESFNASLGGSDAITTSYVNNLENIATAAGTDVVQALAAAQRGAAAFGTPGDKESQLAAGTAVAGAATQNALVTGTNDVNASTSDLIGIGEAYGKTADQLGDITNAVAVAHNVFGASTKDIQDGLAGIADVGATSGYTLTQLAQVVGRVASITGESGATISTALTRIFTTLKTPSTSADLANTLGIQLSGSVKDKIEELAAAYPKLTKSQQDALAAQVGGAKGLRDFLPLLDGQPALQAAYKKAIDDTTAGQRAANAEINSLGGQLRQFGALVKQTGLDIAKSGILEPFILLFGAIKPLLELLDQGIQFFDKLPGPVRETAAALIAATVAINAFRAASAAGLSTGAGAALAGTRQLAGKLLNPFSIHEDTVGNVAHANTIAARDAAARTAAVTDAGLIAKGKAAEAENAARGTAGEDAAIKNRIAVENKAAADLRIAMADEVRIRQEGAAELKAAQDLQANTVREGTLKTAFAANLANRRAGGTVASDFAALTARRAARNQVIDDAAGLRAATSAETAAGLSRTAARGGAGSLFFPSLFGKSEAAAAETGMYAEGGKLAQGGALQKLGLGANAASVGLFGLAAAAIAVGVVIDKEFRAGQAQQKADKGYETALGAGQGTGTASALTAAADRNRKAADAIAHASGGFFGTIEGVIGEGEGATGNRGQQKNQLRALAAAQDDASARLAAINSTTSGAFDLSAVDGVTTGLKTLTLHGQDAAHQIAALNGALDATAKLAPGASRSLTPENAQRFAVTAGANTVSQLTNFLGLEQDQADQVDENGKPLIQTKSLDKLRNIDKTGLSQALSQDATDVLKEVGAGAGQALTPEKIHAANAKYFEKLKAELKKRGIDWQKDLTDKQRQDYEDAAKLDGVFASLDGQTPLTITPENAAQIAAAEPQLAQQLGQNVTTSATLNGAKPINGQAGSAQLEGAQARLDSLLETRKKLISEGKLSDVDLYQYDQEVTSARVDVMSATIEHIQALDALAAAGISQFDKAGQIDAAIKGLQDKIAAEKAGTQKTNDQAQLLKLQQQKDDQRYADASAKRRVNVDPRDPVANAQADLTDAKKHLEEIKREAAKQGVPPSGEEYDKARKDVNDKSIAYKQAVQQQAALNRDAAVAVGDTVGTAFAQAADTYAKAATEIGAQKKSDLRLAAQQFADATQLKVQQDLAEANAATDPRNLIQLDQNKIASDQAALAKKQKLTPGDKTGIANLQTQLAQDQQKLVQDQLAATSAIAGGAIDPRNSVALAKQKLDDAQAALAAALPGQADYGQKQQAVRQAQIDLATATRESAIQVKRGKLDPRDTLGQDRLDIEAARAALAALPAGAGAAAKAAAQQELNAKLIQYRQDQVEYAHDAAIGALDPQDTVGQANEALKQALRALHAASPKQKDYGQLLANVRIAQQAAAVAANDRRLATALATIDPRDTTAVDQAELAHTEGEIKNYKGSHKDDAYQALLQKRKQQQIQLAQDSIDKANAQEESGIDSRNTVAEASAKVDAAKRQLDSDKKGTTKYYQDLKAYHDAQVAEAQTAQSLANAQAEAGLASGDTLGQAQVALQEAQAALALDLVGSQQYYEDLRKVKDAQAALATAQEAAANVTTLLGSDTTNQVDVANAAVAAAQRKLDDDRARGAAQDTIDQDTLDLRNAENGAQKTAFEQQLQDAQTNLALHRISGTAYLQYLEAKRDELKATGLGTRQLLDEYNEVSQAILSANEQLTGQFNIGNIEVPTIYQERRLAGQNGIDISAPVDDTLTALGPTDPLTTAAQDTFRPLVAAVKQIQTQQAVSQLTDLQAAIDVLGGGVTPGSSASPLPNTQAIANTTNNTTINGADFAKVIEYLGSVLGAGAIGSRALTAQRKVS